MAVKDKTTADLRVELGNHLDDARSLVRKAVKIAERMGMRRTHEHLLDAAGHIDDALAVLAEAEAPEGYE